MAPAMPSRRRTRCDHGRHELTSPTGNPPSLLSQDDTGWPAPAANPAAPQPQPQPLGHDSHCRKTRAIASGREVCGGATARVSRQQASLAIRRRAGFAGKAVQSGDGWTTKPNIARPRRADARPACSILGGLFVAAVTLRPTLTVAGARSCPLTASASAVADRQTARHERTGCISAAKCDRTVALR